MKRLFFIISASVVTFCSAMAQDVKEEIATLLHAYPEKPFNGIVAVEGGSGSYTHIVDAAELRGGKKSVAISTSTPFTIGSISKQMTAVMTLLLYERGLIQLHLPIRRYLPKLRMGWADTVTVHQLLTHTHGITQLDQPLSFTPGTKYAYSQIGYELLANIMEHVTGKSFERQSEMLFKKCGMYNTHYPSKKYAVFGYEEDSTGKPVQTRLQIPFVAAGGFVSTVDDMLIWNKLLHGGKILADSTYRLMVTKHKNATRNHQLFGITDYGYGITVDTKDGILQLGQTGLVPGFACMNFYFPRTKTSIVILSNLARNWNNLPLTFRYHTETLKIIRSAQPKY